MLTIGIPRESRNLENRVAATPDSIKKLLKKKGIQVRVEKNAGAAALFSDQDFQSAGAEIVEDKKLIYHCDIILKVQKPNLEEISLFKKGSTLLAYIEPFEKDGSLEKLAAAGVNVLGLELVPRTSRAQSMDALSSQANIAGYRAVLEASTRYGRYFSMMMTSAGMAKPAKVIVMGAGVAGLQAIATARRLGAVVEAFDVRKEVKEQILSLGAKFIEIDLGEEGSGVGGYAKELSEAAKARQIAGLSEKIKKADVVISTANIPGKKAPILISEEAVKGMRTGSVIVDMAAANGGNCALTVKDEVVQKFGVTLVGITNFPSLLPSDSSNFYANNLLNLMNLFLLEKEGATHIQFNLEDDIIAASLATLDGAVRFGAKGNS